MGIETDSKGVQDAKDPETCNVFRIFSLVASSESSAALAERYRAGGMGYGDAKKLLLAELRTLFAPIEEKRRYWEAHPSDVDDVLAAGAKKARANAATVLQRARRACGID